MKPLVLSAAAAVAAGLALPALPVFAYDPIISLSNRHTVIQPNGATQEILATSDQTGGAFSAMTIWGIAGEGPGPSITHTIGSETWYVLEGEYEFHVGDETFEGGPGTFVSVDVGQSHGFINKTDGKLLVIFSPGGYERFFMEWANTPGLVPGPALGALENKYGVTRPAP